MFEVIRLFLYFIGFLSDLKRTKFAGNEWKIRMEMCTDVNLKTGNNCDAIFSFQRGTTIDANAN